MTDLPDSGWLRQIVLDSEAGISHDAVRVAQAPGAEWIVLTSTQVAIKSALAAHLLTHADARPDVGIFYVDEFVHDAHGAQPFLKPDFDLTWLLTYNYVGLPLCVRSDVLARLGGICGDTGTFQAYCLLLEAASAGIAISRIPEVLAERRMPAVYDQPAHMSAVARWLGPGRSLHEIVEGRLPATLELHRALGPHAAPSLTICMLQDELHSSSKTTTAALLQRLQDYRYPAPIQLIVEQGATTDLVPPASPVELTVVARDVCRTRARNRMWQASAHDVVLFLDSRIELPAKPSWLAPVLAHSLQEDVGGCSPMVLGNDGRIQYAGMAADSFGLVGLPWHGHAVQDQRALREVGVSREWSMLCGWAFATRRALLEECNGFDEHFGPDLAVPDLSLRMRMLGLRLVCAAPVPLAAAIALDVVPFPQASAGEWALFMERWHPFLEQDPCWHPDKHFDGC